MIISNNTKITKNLALLFSSYLFFICCTHSTLLILHYLLPSRVVYFISVCCKRVEFSGRTSGCLFFPWDTHTNVVVRVQRLFLSNSRAKSLAAAEAQPRRRKKEPSALSLSPKSQRFSFLVYIAWSGWLNCVRGEWDKQKGKKGESVVGDIKKGK